MGWRSGLCVWGGGGSSSGFLVSGPDVLLSQGVSCLEAA